MSWTILYRAFFLIHIPARETFLLVSFGGVENKTHSWGNENFFWRLTYLNSLQFQFTVSEKNLNRFEREWAFPQSIVGWKQYWCCLSLLRQRIQKSQATGWICTDWEQRQLMIAYQRLRFSIIEPLWGMSFFRRDFSPEKVTVLGYSIFNLTGMRWEWAPPLPLIFIPL